MEKNACGIVSYAGLSRETLLSQAKATFSQAQPPVPRRFDAFLPLFPVELVQNMDYMGGFEARSTKVGPSGFSIDPIVYHRKLYAQIPGLYAQDNYARNFDYEGRYVGNGVFAVDAAWVDHFPQYQPFFGEKLMIYLIGGGFQAVAVPESVYPRGGGIVESAEQTMQIAQRAELFMQYARTKIANGDHYDPEAFSAEFLRVAGLAPVCFTQAELGKILQDLSMIKNLQNESAGVGLYTENARRAERVNQYVPMRYACDLFTFEAVDKYTAKLAQLCCADSDFISDIWIPYQDFYAYVDRRHMTLDVRALCEGYQIAPRFDPETSGGRFPDAVRVVAVRDRDLSLLVGEVINNPAYGNGMSPQGMIGRQVYIADSREMLRQRKLTLEELPLTVENLTLPSDEYRRSLALAILQEHKGRLVDAMYRREKVLMQIAPGSPVYEKACQLLNDRVKRLEDIVKKESAQNGMSQMSGYDADVDYLRRMQMDREGLPEESAGQKPIAFATDAQREQSIESGYAMRAGLTRMMYADAALPEPPAERTLGADDSEDEGSREPLPPLPVNAATPARASLPIVKPAPPEADEVVVAAPSTGNGRKTAQKENGAPISVALPKKATQAAETVKPIQTAHATVTATPSDVENVTETAKSAARAQREGFETPAGATQAVETLPAKIPATKEPNRESAQSGASLPLPGIVGHMDREAEAESNAATSHESVENALRNHEERKVAIPADNSADAREDEPQNKDSDTERSAPMDGGDAAPEDAAGGAQLSSHHRVSLRELTDRVAAEPESPTPEQPAQAAEEPSKPKLAYILRRGSETEGSKAFKRMSDMLERRNR